MSNDQTIGRKVKEAILSFRIEQAYSKDRILELYLNEIFFGLNSYGIAGAALTYFNKSVNELTVAEAAYLAALPKGPSNYHPFRQPERAVERRNWVIDRMAENGYMTMEEAKEAKAEPLGVTPRQNRQLSLRFRIFRRRGPSPDHRPLWRECALRGRICPFARRLIRNCRCMARAALQHGLFKYDHARGYRGAYKTISTNGDWGIPLSEIKAFSDVPDWQLAVVLEVTPEQAIIGLQPERDASDKLASERKKGTIDAADIKWAFRLLNGDKRTTAKSAGEYLQRGRCGFRPEEGRQRDGLRPSTGSEDRGRCGGYGSAYGPRSGDGGWFLLRRVRVQPRHAGNASAGLVLQALRLFSSA